MTVAEFWTSYLWPLIILVAQSVMLLVILLVSIAYILLADRKIWAAVQIRRGPNVVGPWGLLQSFADLLKFVFKEPIIPAGSNKGVFLLAPLVTCTLGEEGEEVANRLGGNLLLEPFGHERLLRRRERTSTRQPALKSRALRRSYRTSRCP